MAPTRTPLTEAKKGDLIRARFSKTLVGAPTQAEHLARVVAARQQRRSSGPPVRRITASLLCDEPGSEPRHAVFTDGSATPRALCTKCERALHGGAHPAHRPQVRIVEDGETHSRGGIVRLLDWASGTAEFGFMSAEDEAVIARATDSVISVEDAGCAELLTWCVVVARDDARLVRASSSTVVLLGRSRLRRAATATWVIKGPSADLGAIDSSVRVFGATADSEIERALPFLERGPQSDPARVLLHGHAASPHHHLAGLYDLTKQIRDYMIQSS